MRRPATVARVLALAAGGLVAPIVATAAPSTPPAETALALTAGAGSGELVAFHVDAPGVVVARVALTGLQPGEHLLGIDVYQTDFKVYALSDQSRMYAVDPSTGACTLVGAGPVPLAPALAGTHFEIDMGTQSDPEMRVVSDADENRYITPQLASNNGSWLAFNYVPSIGTTPHVVALAAVYYPPGKFRSGGAHVRNLFYGIDGATSGVVVDVGSSEYVGEIAPVGPLGFTVGSVQGFDASLFTRAAYLAATPSGQATPHFYSVSLASGAATDLGAMTFDGTTGPVTSFCLLPPPPIPLRLFSSDGTTYDLTVTPGVSGTPTSRAAPKAAPTVLSSTSPEFGGMGTGDDSLDVDSSGTVTYFVDRVAKPGVVAWTVVLPGFDPTGDAYVETTLDGDVYVANGNQAYHFKVSDRSHVTVSSLSYAPEDPLFDRAPVVMALAGGAQGTASRLLAIDQIDTGLNQNTFTFDPADYQAHTVGPTGLAGAGTHAAMTTLADGQVLLGVQYPFNIQFFLIEAQTGTAMPFSTSDLVAGDLVGLGRPAAMPTTSDDFKVGASKGGKLVKISAASKTARTRHVLQIIMDVDTLILHATSPDGSVTFNGQAEYSSTIVGTTAISVADAHAIGGKYVMNGLHVGSIQFAGGGAGAQTVEVSDCTATRATCSMGTDPGDAVVVDACTVGSLTCTGTGSVEVDSASGASGGSAIHRATVKLAAGGATFGGGGARTSLENVGVKIADAGRTAGAVTFTNVDLGGSNKVGFGGSDDGIVMNGVNVLGTLNLDGGAGNDTAMIAATSVAGSFCGKRVKSAPTADVGIYANYPTFVALQFNYVTGAFKYDSGDYVEFLKTIWRGSVLTMSGRLGHSPPREVELHITYDVASGVASATANDTQYGPVQLEFSK